MSSRVLGLPAWWQLNDRTHAPALDMVTDGADVDVQLPRESGLPSVLLLKVLLIVHISLHIIHERVLPVSRAQTLEAPLWLHHSWISGKKLNKEFLKSLDPWHIFMEINIPFIV